MGCQKCRFDEDYFHDDDGEDNSDNEGDDEYDDSPLGIGNDGDNKGSLQIGFLEKVGIWEFGPNLSL